MTNVQPMREKTADGRQNLPTQNPTRYNDDEIQIRQAIDDFGQAFCAKDLNRVISHYASNVVAFDLMPPLKYDGLEAWRDLWQKSLSMMNGTIEFEMRGLNIDVSGDMAIAHGLNHFKMKGDEDVDTWMRWTASFRKIGGKWLVTHEHTSVPADMESGKALMDLKP